MNSKSEAMVRLQAASPFKASDPLATISPEELDALRASISTTPLDPRPKRRWASLSVPKRTAVIALVAGVMGVGGGLAAAASHSTSSLPSSTTKPLYSEAARKVIDANLRKLATCMHAHGFPTFPEPKPDYGNGKVPVFQIGGANGGNFDPTSPQARSALSACSVGMQRVPGNLGAKAFPRAP
jgi:hypothetical protein